MKRIIALCLFCTTVIAFIGCAKDEEDVTGSIYGIVTDAATGEPVSSANVSLSPSGKSIVTGNDGRYEFSGLTPGQYTVQVTKNEYESNTKQITVVAGEQASGDITLQQASSQLKLTNNSLNFGKYWSTLSFGVGNAGITGSIEWRISAGDVDWISVTPLSGTTETGKTTEVVVSVLRDKVSGPANGIITISDEGGSLPIYVTVNQEVEEEPDKHYVAVDPEEVVLTSQQKEVKIYSYNGATSYEMFVKESDVTAESVFFMKRRQVLKALGISAAALSLPHAAHADLLSWFKGNDRPPAPAGKPLEFSKPAAWQNNLPLTPVDKVSGYNNFYEFGLDKADPAANAGSLKTDPWTLKISGEVAKPLTLDHDDLTRRFPLEERIYRMRCVEAWSMVVPWIGFPLHKLLALAEPTSNAKYVAFETIYAPEQMPGQQDRFIGGGLKYPYVEGLRLDEAMHPLTLMTVGVYGKALPPQNGAPVRLIVPWKYGFKGIKSIVSIKLTRERPPTTWNLAAPDEYGFYANVNPHVDHPRWSQATERFIGSGGILDVQRQPTLLFNGYADQVASLYRGLDLRENF